MGTKLIMTRYQIELEVTLPKEGTTSYKLLLSEMKIATYGTLEAIQEKEKDLINDLEADASLRPDEFWEADLIVYAVELWYKDTSDKYGIEVEVMHDQID